MLPMPRVDGDIFDCIQRGNIDQCAHIIQHDRSILKKKGWSDFTPLHFAALNGNRSIVNLLLSNGADPNLTCDAGMTAFHLACRHGNVYVMHQMMQHGADLRMVDHQGKTALHHGVSGGNMWCDGDMYHVTPLHLAADAGNTEVVRYLLRYKRCMVETVDEDGLTAVHVASERGCVEMCWTLLQRSGFRILHLKTYSGHTPLDLCRQGRTFRHLQLSKLLTRYMKEPPFSKPDEVLTQDPGELGPGDADPRYSSIADLLEKKQNPQRFCIYCEPDHTKHCKLCDVCVRDYDHHCLFLNRCIGRGNHRLFISFILSMAAAHLLFVAAATYHLYVVVVSLEDQSLVRAVAAQFWVVTLTIMNALTILWEAWLLTEQFDAIAMGTTTYFKPTCETRQRSPGHRWTTFFTFLLEGRRREEESVQGCKYTGLVRQRQKGGRERWKERERGRKRECNWKGDR
ncbi:unnamed protein product [Coregonus sp. 'balchen']|nr:unnamed protein product [Coregonus sp. 'balchen']